MSVRVVRDVSCPACWRNGPPSDVGRVDMTGICVRCHGFGTIIEPVTCAGCRWFCADTGTCDLFSRVGWDAEDQERETPLTPWCSCDDLDIPKQNQIVYVDDTFACVAWEPRA